MNVKIVNLGSEITMIKKQNLEQKNRIEELTSLGEKKLDELFNDFIQVIDSFEKSETKIKEIGLSDDENVAKAMKRMLQPKKKILSILSKYNINQIDLKGKFMDENLCTVVDTEPDMTKEEGLVISIEKNGYIRGDRLIRRAEVIIVKN